MVKCIIKDCPNEEYHATGIYNSRYCEKHLDMDENLKPFTLEQADEYFKNHVHKTLNYRVMCNDCNIESEQIFVGYKCPKCEGEWQVDG